MKSGNSLKIKRSKQFVLFNDFEQKLKITEDKYLGGDASIDTIKMLIEHYSLAMEYYNSIEDTELYAVYQAKNNAMLQNSHVLRAIEGSSNYTSVDEQNEIYEKDENQLLKTGTCEFAPSKKEHVSQLFLMKTKLRLQATDIVKASLNILADKQQIIGKCMISEINCQNSNLENSLIFDHFSRHNSKARRSFVGSYKKRNSSILKDSCKKGKAIPNF